MHSSAQNEKIANIDLAVVGEDQTFAEEYLHFDRPCGFSVVCLSTTALM